MTRRGRSKRILVVSTDTTTRARTRDALAELGFGVDCRSAAEDVVKHVRQRRPLAMLVDAQLGGHKCAEVVAGCRDELSRDEMPILILAGTPRAALDAIRAGAQGCVKAPVEVSTLSSMLTQVRVATV